MSELPDRAQVVVIGAGIVGNCLVGHLADKGWRDILLVDKGPLPDPGGSTGHASNFIFPVDHGKELAMLTLDSQRQYEAMGVQVSPGGIEVARTEERMEELRRRMASAKAWGVEAELISPARIKELVPFVDESILLGGFWTPSTSVVDSLQAGTLMRQRATDAGALTVSAVPSAGGTSWTSFLNPLRALPMPSPICGSLPAPKMIRMMTRIMMSSEKPSVPNICRSLQPLVFQPFQDFIRCPISKSSQRAVRESVGRMRVNFEAHRKIVHLSGHRT
jgi:hypothetical protein